MSAAADRLAARPLPLVPAAARCCFPARLLALEGVRGALPRPGRRGQVLSIPFVVVRLTCMAATERRL
ncbi:MAG: hypothetical protein MZW92_30895, partial [Comamonadaceae bacterium]|nr:hypothetical protein [Comamonadaceae bacterium]